MDILEEIHKKGEMERNRKNKKWEMGKIVETRENMNKSHKKIDL